MAGCDVLYHDPSKVGQPRRHPAGHALGPASDGWQPCTAPGHAWTDPDLILRWICTRHRRQLVAGVDPAWWTPKMRALPSRWESDATPPTVLPAGVQG